jgi:hypothetical protein
MDNLPELIVSIRFDSRKHNLAELDELDLNISVLFSQERKIYPSNLIIKLDLDPI